MSSGFVIEILKKGKKKSWYMRKKRKYILSENVSPSVNTVDIYYSYQNIRENFGIFFYGFFSLLDRDFNINE